MEEVVCVVEGVRAAAGMYKADDAWAFNEYDLFFTDKRLIFAVVLGRRYWQTIPSNKEIEAIAAAVAENERSAEEIKAVAAATSLLTGYKDAKKRVREQFKGKTPDEILSLDPGSFEIPYERVKTVKLSKSILSRTLEISASWKGQEKKLSSQY